MFRTFLFQTLNTALVPYLVGNIRAFNLQDKSIFEINFVNAIFAPANWYAAIAPQIFAILVLDSLLGNVLRLIHPIARFKHWVLATLATRQADINRFMQPPVVLISELYSNSLKMLFVAIIYGTSIPLSYLIYLTGFAVAYWVDKYNLLRVCQRPPKIQRSVSKVAAIVACFAPAVKILSGFPFYKHFIDSPQDNPASLLYLIILLTSLSLFVISVIFISGDFIARKCFSFSPHLKVIEDGEDIPYDSVSHIEVFQPPLLPPIATFKRSTVPLNPHVAKSQFQGLNTTSQDPEDPAPPLSPHEAPRHTSDSASTSVIPEQMKVSQVRRSYHSRISVVNSQNNAQFSVLDDRRTPDGRLVIKDTVNLLSPRSNPRSQIIHRKSSISMSTDFPIKGGIKILVLSAMKLPLANGNIPSPYCVIRLVGSCSAPGFPPLGVATGKPKKKSRNPEWIKKNVILINNLTAKDLSAGISVAVYSSTRLGGIYPLGQIGFLSIDDFNVKGLVSTKSYALEPLPGQHLEPNETCGTLKLQISFKNYEWPRKKQPKRSPLSDSPTNSSPPPVITPPSSALAAPSDPLP